MLAKQLEYLADAQMAGIVLGARVPIMLTSRADHTTSRLGSCAIGLALAYLLTRFLASLLFSVKAGDPWTLAAVAAILSLVALIATFIPARRAAATDPGQALHYQ